MIAVDVKRLNVMVSIRVEIVNSQTDLDAIIRKDKKKELNPQGFLRMRPTPRR